MTPIAARGDDVVVNISIRGKDYVSSNLTPHTILIFIMKKITYKGTVREDSYAHRTSTGYDPCLFLDTDIDRIILGHGHFRSVFTKLRGKRIKLTIKVLD